MTLWQRLQRPLLVIGGAVLDITATTAGEASLLSHMHTSTPGQVRQSLGGVARNVCEAAIRTGAPAFLLSVVGDDFAGRVVRQGMTDVGMDTRFLKTQKQQATAVYNALHTNDGQLIAAVADMEIFNSMLSDDVATIIETEKPSIVCFDGNMTLAVMSSIADQCQSLRIPVFFEPTSVTKSVKIFDRVASIISSRSIFFTSPNQFELEAMSDAIATARQPPPWHQPGTDKARFPLQWTNAPSLAHRMLPYALQLSGYIPHVITKLGAHGCLYVGNCGDHHVVEYVPPEPIDFSCIKNVTGAGDSFVGALLSSLWRMNPNFVVGERATWRAIISYAQQAAILSLQSELAVSPDLSCPKPL